MATIFDWFDFELNEIKCIIRLDKVCIDNHVFRLHYKLTVPVIMALSFLQACRLYFGDPIDCVQGDDVPRNVLETFCWIHSTFTLPGAWNKKAGVEVPYPGIDASVPGERRIYHKYYQWVGFVLFLQGVLFYTPRYLWKVWEAGRMKSIVMGLSSPIMNTEERDENRALLVEYLKVNMNKHCFYASKFVLAEALNLLNVVGQIYVMNDFLGGAFTTYGVDVARFSALDQENRSDPMIRVFPRMTKCIFHRFGSSGDIQKYDALCLLPLNVFNEKIYIFLWFWFLYLAIVSSVVLLYRVVLFVSPAVRYIVLRSRSRISNRTAFAEVMSQTQFGDWFVLNLLCKNMDSVHYGDVIEELAKQLAEGEMPLMEKTGNNDE